MTEKDLDYSIFKVLALCFTNSSTSELFDELRVNKKHISTRALHTYAQRCIFSLYFKRFCLTAGRQAKLFSCFFDLNNYRQLVILILAGFCKSCQPRTNFILANGQIALALVQIRCEINNFSKPWPKPYFQA